MNLDGRLTRLESVTPCAERAYSLAALRELTDEELAALERFCQRAEDDPGVEPVDDAERAALARYEALVRRATPPRGWAQS